VEQSNKSSCIRVTTRDGRYQALIDVDPSDCGQTKKESGMSDGAKVAVGAAALLGIAALAHKSHHRDDRNFSEQQTADFERGYRDGLYNNSFNSRGGSGEYSDGYNQGVSERSQQSGYRYGSGNDNYNSGWTRCAAEGEYCRVNGSSRVRFGGDNRYEYRNVTGGIQCSVQQFGDPAYGVNKSCEYLSHGGGYGNVNYGNNWESLQQRRRLLQLQRAGRGALRRQRPIRLTPRDQRPALRCEHLRQRPRTQPEEAVFRSEGTLRPGLTLSGRDQEV
jgi:hypothetical protein